MDLSDIHLRKKSLEVFFREILLQNWNIFLTANIARFVKTVCNFEGYMEKVFLNAICTILWRSEGNFNQWLLRGFMFTPMLIVFRTVRNYFMDAECAKWHVLFLWFCLIFRYSLCVYVTFLILLFRSILFYYFTSFEMNR